MDLFSGKRLRSSQTDGRRANHEMKYDYRSPIESDLGRVIFSSACRRLHDKTQVFPLTSNDNIHSRLTHSMEVMSIGHSFALNLFEIPAFKDIVGVDANDANECVRKLRDFDSLLTTVCLAHDIGNPPFGHFGETALQCYFERLFDDLKNDLKQSKDTHVYHHPIILGMLKVAKEEQQDKVIEELTSFLDDVNLAKLDFTCFDGNAQGFRVLTKLQFLNDLYGLNLTSASLAAFIKYPNFGPKDKSRSISTKKHGVFTTESMELNQVMKNCGIIQLGEHAFNRHPFSYLMEAADTICYLIMDYEDAISKGWVKYEDFKQILKNDADGKKVLNEAEKHFNENAPSKKKMVQLRTELMNHFVSVAIDNFMTHYDEILKGDYKKELVFDTGNNSGLATTIQDICRKNIYSHLEIESLELTGNAVLTGIIDYYVKYLFHPEKSFRIHAKHLISKSTFQAVLQEHFQAIGEKKDAWDYYEDFDPKNFTFEERMRLIRDFVAGMTDKFAVAHYRKLNGQQI